MDTYYRSHYDSWKGGAKEGRAMFVVDIGKVAGLEDGPVTRISVLPK